jgi:zinc transport system substrate-binding protein
MSEAEKTESWLSQNGRPLAGIGIVFGVVLLVAAIIAVLGRPANPSLFAATSDGKPLIAFAGIPPVAYLVQRIGGPRVHVEVLLQAGKDPHVFAPTPRQVIALGQARLFFRVGMPFEDRLIEHVAGGPAGFTVVDTVAGIVPRAPNCIRGVLSPHPSPLPEGEGDHDDEGGADPHVWLSPPLLKTMAAHVSAAFCQADPGHEQFYRSNLKTLHAELDALDRRIAHSLAPYRGQSFYVFHPAFGYFADTYGLRQESVEVEGKPPTPRQVFGLINKAREDHVKLIFLQPQFNEQIAASIAQAIGGAVMPMDDLAYDVVANLDDIAQNIAASNGGKTK